MIHPINQLPAVIPVGIQTEHGVCEVRFDVSRCLDKWPEMNFEVWPTRPGENEAYPAVSELDGDILTWHVGAVDTEKEGLGKVEIVGITPDGLHKKHFGPVDTAVKKTSLAMTQDMPDVHVPYYEALLAANADAKAVTGENAKDAAESAQEAAQASDAARQYSTNADKQAASAGQAAASADTSAKNAAASAAAAEQAKKDAIKQADDADASAKSAKEDAVRAETFAGNAQTAASSASASAQAADKSERNAGSYSSIASTHAANAKNSATSANQSAQTSAQSASEAASSKSAAASSASSAATSASNAASAAQAATSKANTANTAATNASASATAASKSAQEAKASETSAASSATEAAEAATRAEESVAGLLVVRSTRTGEITHTYADIEAALAADKACIFADDGIVYSFTGRTSEGLTFAAINDYGDPGKNDGISLDVVVFKPDGTQRRFGFTPVRTPNPLPITFSGAVEAEYWGDQHVNVEIPEMPDVYIVKVASDGTCDHTKQEINGAAMGGKVCLMVYYNGEVLEYKGTTKYEDEFSCPYFVGPLHQLSNERWYASKIIVLNNSKVVLDSGPIAMQNPYTLQLTGAVDATYDGSEGVSVEIPAGGLPETADPLKQLVTDADGKVVWEDRLSYSEPMEYSWLYNCPFMYVGDEDGFPTHVYLSEFGSTFDVMPMKGYNQTVTYNGVQYDCQAVEMSMEGVSVILLGNTDVMGVPGGNADAPFFLMVIPEEYVASMGANAMLYALDGATSVTLSLDGYAEHVIPINKKYMPSNRLVVTCDVVLDGNQVKVENFSNSFYSVRDAFIRKQEVVLYMGAGDSMTRVPCVACTDSKAEFMTISHNGSSPVYMGILLNSDETVTVKQEEL